MKKEKPKKIENWEKEFDKKWGEKFVLRYKKYPNGIEEVYQVDEKKEIKQFIETLLQQKEKEIEKDNFIIPKRSPVLIIPLTPKSKPLNALIQFVEKELKKPKN